MGSGTEQAKDRQKKKSGTKGIRVDAEGLASFEDFETAELRDNDYEPPDVEKTKSSGKKVIISPLNTSIWFIWFGFCRILLALTFERNMAGLFVL